MQTRGTTISPFLVLSLGVLVTTFAFPALALAGPYTAPGDKALVYVIQGPTGSFANLPVSVNGRPLQYLTQNSYFGFVVAPGVQEISTAASGRTAVSLVVASGSTYYLRISVNAQGEPEIVQLGDSMGEEELGRARRIGDHPMGAALSRARTPAAARPGPSASVSEPARERTGSDAGIADMPNTVILKAGTYKLSKDTQDFLGSTQTFDGKSKSVWGAEYEYRVWHGVAIGAEYGQFRNTMTSSDSTLPSTMDVKLFLVKVKKYFEFSDIFQPYVGVGVGAAWANFDGWINGDSVGGAYAALGGMEFRFKHVGVYTEYRYLSSKTSGKQEVTNDTVNIHVGGSGAFAGVSIHF